MRRERDEALEQLAKARAKVARTKDAMKLVGVVRGRKAVHPSTRNCRACGRVSPHA